MISACSATTAVTITHPVVDTRLILLVAERRTRLNRHQ